MKELNIIVLGLLIFIGVSSCKDEEQSCSDGVFSPDKEEEVDCGGVCPPCPSDDGDAFTSILLTNVNDTSIIFYDYSLTKNPDWILSFSNDSIMTSLNFGDGDSLGARSINPMNSVANYNSSVYSTLISGTVIFSEINHSDKRLSGFFEAKFLSDSNSNDTLIIKNGDFEDILWE